MKVVFTGGVCAGKTTVINLLESQNYNVIQESAMATIGSLQQDMGMKRQKAWMMDHFLDFQLMNIRRQVVSEANINSDELCFLDRGVQDYIAFCRLRNHTPSTEILAEAENHNYNRVFHFNVLDSFGERKRTGRVMTKEKALELAEITETVYEEYGYDVIKVPVMKPEDRIEYILNHIKGVTPCPKS